MLPVFLHQSASSFQSPCTLFDLNPLHTPPHLVRLLQELWLISGHVPQIFLLIHLVRLFNQLSFSFPAQLWMTSSLYFCLPSWTVSHTFSVTLHPPPSLNTFSVLFKYFSPWLMPLVTDINLNQVIRSPGQLILFLMLLQESVFTVCSWVKYSGSLCCLTKAANCSGVKLWNCWVTQSLGVWLPLLWPEEFAGEKALSPPRNPGITVRAGGTLQSLNAFTASQNVLSAVPAHAIAYFSSMYCELQQLQTTFRLLVSLSSHRKQILHIYRTWDEY